MPDWETGRARAELFASVLPRAVLSARNAGRGDPASGIPASPVGVRAVGETVIDEFFIAINSVIRDIPPNDEIERSVGRCAEVAAGFTELGALGMNVDPPIPLILGRDRKLFGTTGFHQIDFSVQPDFPILDPADDPYRDGLTSMRVLSRGGTGRRWLIWVHGAAQGRSDDLYAFRAAHLHKNLGYDVAFPVLPAHGSRRRDKVAYPGLDPLLNVAMTLRAVAEIRSLIGWIAAHDPIDITIAGTSLGGPIAALVASLDKRVSSVLAVVPMLDMHGTLAHHMDRAGSRGRQLAALMRSDAVRAVSSVVDPLSVEPYARSARRMVVAALNDRVTSVTAASRLHDHWGGGVHWYRGSHVGHAISGEIRRAVDDFLRSAPGPDEDLRGQQAVG